MLPFLDSKKMSSVIMKKQSPSGEVKPAEDIPADSLHMACEDLLSAIEAKDPSAMANALSAAFSMLDDDEMDEGNE